jgi:hypothetical protein
MLSRYFHAEDGGGHLPANGILGDVHGQGFAHRRAVGNDDEFAAPQARIILSISAKPDETP